MKGFITKFFTVEQLVAITERMEAGRATCCSMPAILKRIVYNRAGRAARGNGPPPGLQG
jgi:hypothetical protein